MRRIAADYLFTLAQLGKELRPVRNGAVTVDSEGTVTDIGQLTDEEAAAAAAGNLPGTEFYRGILCPGFVNSHCHIELSHLKGAFREATGMSGFINQINELRESVDKEGRAEAMAAEFEDFRRQGVVAVSDISNCDESFPFKKQYADGSMPVYYRTFVELFGTEPEDAGEVLEGGKAIAAKAREMGLDAAVTPHSCYTMSPELLEMTAAEALRSGFLSYHSQESGEEEEMIMHGSGALWDNYKGRNLSTPPVTGTTALEYFLERLEKGCGGFRNGNGRIKGKINLVHNIVISKRSIEAAANVLEEPYFTICPLSNIFIHRALPPLDTMRAHNLDICLGTDSLSSNRILSITEEIKCLNAHFPHIHLNEILVWACCNGARMLGLEGRLGSIEPGKRPGIVLITEVDCGNRFRLTPESISTRLA